MRALLKFYARNAKMKNLVMTSRGGLIFDSDFYYGLIEDSSFDTAVFNNCKVVHTTFKNVSQHLINNGNLDGLGKIGFASPNYGDNPKSIEVTYKDLWDLHSRNER